ncbi:MAG: hypothetical protein ILO34_04795 [Kiritimatiellae bacterium]|nr:hypothetical protein [Kiritimatiellia bacterium]
MISLLAAAMSSIAHALAWPIETTDKTVAGAWMDNFANATNLAYTTKTPMVLFWANTGCEYCELLEDAINSAEFQAWQKQNDGFVYNFVYASDGNDLAPNAGSGAKEFAATAGGTMKKGLMSYPFVCLYWPKEDGTVAVKSVLGRSGQLDPATAQSGGTLAKEFEACIEKFFAGYDAPVKVGFAMSGGEYDRLEAEPSTIYVDVPMVRTGGAGNSAETVLVARFPDGILPDATNAVKWTAGQTDAFSRVYLALPDGAAFPAGKTVSLIALGEDGAIQAEGAIHFVEEVPVSVENPKFVGEEFDYGEWTMDYAAAKKKGGYILANFSGVLWCPYCYGMDHSLLASEEFARWAKDNKVSLVLFDQSRASDPATAAGSGQARLLSYAAGNSSTLGGLASGAGYLSRKSIAQDEVKKVVDEVTRRTVEWLAPESTAARLGNPTLLLVENDKVSGRFSAWRDADRYYDPVENISRLDDLLKLAGSGGESANYASVTTRTIPVPGKAIAVYQINDRTEFFVLSELKPGVLRVVAAGDRDIGLELVADGKVVAEGTGSLEARISRTVLAAQRIVLKTTGSMPDRIGAGSSVFTGEISTSLEPGSGAEQFYFAANFQQSADLEKIDTANVKSATAKKTSGTMPSGLKLVYDKTSGTVKIAGAAKKPGTYTFSYTVATRTAGVRQVSDPVEIEISVIDPKTSNPFAGTADKATVALVRSASGSDLPVPAGAVALSFSAKGKISAKHVDSSGKTTSFSGAWSVFDADTGAICATLSKKGAAMDIVLDAGGIVSVSVAGFAGSGLLGATGRFDGLYTVALPVESTTAAYRCAGAGSMVLTVKNGKASIKGTLPDGAAMNLTTAFSIDPDDKNYALIPVVKHSGKETLAAVLRVRADGGTLYDDPETVRVVRSPAGLLAKWTHSAAGDAFESLMEVYGGYFVKGKTTDDWRGLFELGPVKAEIDGTPSQVTYKYNASTGVVSGTGKDIVLSDGARASGTFKGVLTPGWIDCQCAEEEFPGQFIERPFASGTFHYKTSSGGRRVAASVPFELTAD